MSAISFLEGSDSEGVEKKKTGIGEGAQVSHGNTYKEGNAQTKG